MNKRGVEDLLWNIILIVLIISILMAFFYWIENASSGSILKAEVDSKQVALLIDSARQGTTLYIEKDVSIEGNKVKAEYGKSYEEYLFFNKNSISYTKKDNATEVSIK